MGMCVLIVVSYIFSSTLQAIVCRTHIYYRPLISGSGLVCANERALIIRLSGPHVGLAIVW